MTNQEIIEWSWTNIRKVDSPEDNRKAIDTWWTICETIFSQYPKLTQGAQWDNRVRS